MQEASQRLTELQMLKPRVVAVLGFDPTAVSGALPTRLLILLQGLPQALPQPNPITAAPPCCRSLTARSS